MVPRAVLMKSGLVSINNARQNISKTAVSVNTARQVNTAHSKTIVNAARPISYLSKTAHSTIKRPINNNIAFKNSNINQRGNPQMDLQDKGVIDSGCSRHMTGNMSYLTDYEEIDEGYVAFARNPKGGKITRKCTIKTVDRKKIIITESTVRRDLQLEDAEGVDYQAEMGEGLANPTDPHHTPTFIQPSTSQLQKKQKPRKPKRKDTQIPQSSGPTEHVADEAVYKELDDSLVRATTTASSLEAEQDSGNIAKTQSKATPNESSSLRTTSGGGPRRQETIGDTIA
ncbi:hypothetical protein Tco_0117343 [Tanacetum coccineum]